VIGGVSATGFVDQVQAKTQSVGSKK
jgi:hypothetical protein